MNITTGKIAKAQKVILYGPEGIGKSTFASQFPNPLFIDVEGSTSNMDVARMDKPTSWTFLMEQIKFIKQQRPCKTLVVDTIDWAERMGIEHICQINQKNSIEDFGYGAGYIKCEEEVGRLLNLLQDVVDIGINVVLNAHAQMRKFEQPDEMGAYDRYELKLGKKTTARTSALVKEWADMVLFMNYKTFSVASSVDSKGKATNHKAQGGVRTIYANHHPAWDAKNRHGLPDEFPMDYAHIAHIFNGVITPVIAATPVTPPPAVSSTSQTVSQPAAIITIESQLDPSIPKPLLDLMTEHKVIETEIQVVVSKKGYYPFDTPIANYDPNFINGVLVSAWPKVFEMVQSARADMPFS